MPLLIVRNDITKMQTDAIVNPANRELRQGRGTSRAVYLAAGEQELTDACREIGFCEAGNAVLTKGFALPARYVIHAVCPQWQGGACRERELLERTYISALQLAKQHRLESIAFPLLSSGFYGWPKADAFHAATTAIGRFLLQEDMTVYLVLYDYESVEISRKLFASVEEYIDDHYVEEKGESCFAPVKNAVEESCKKSLKKSPGRKQKKDAVCFQQKPAVYSGRFLRARERRLEDLLGHMDETFSEMLLRLIDERGLKDSEVYRKANIDRRLFSKIRKNADYAPSKKTVLSFAIALELSLDETKDLLMKAGFAFSGSSKSDIIISFFIENRQYDIFTINEVLFAYDQPVLGE
ncbi:MAG: macro domain-containing protein [Lachnospiraceae bacterium]